MKSKKLITIIMVLILLVTFAFSATAAKPTEEKRHTKMAQFVKLLEEYDAAYFLSARNCINFWPEGTIREGDRYAVLVDYLGTHYIVDFQIATVEEGRLTYFDKKKDMLPYIEELLKQYQ